MERFLTNLLRRYAMRYGRKAAVKGAGKAFSMGSEALRKRRERKAGPVLDQDPAITGTRKRMSDERKGDEILFPTDDYTHNMQPRK